MKLKELQSILQDIEPFEEPNVELEQYPTGAQLAAQLLFAVESTFGDLGGATVMDLGCGTGMLAIGAALLGCGHVVGVDIDDSALAVAVRNVQQFEEPLPVDLVIGDVFTLAQQQPMLQADTVIMNPPFGTRRKGADMDFLRAALRLSRHAVYSLHKTSTRNHIKTVALRDLGVREAEVLAEMRYDLPASYSFHKMKSKDIAVDLWRFVVAPKGAA